MRSASMVACSGESGDKDKSTKAADTAKTSEADKAKTSSDAKKSESTSDAAKSMDLNAKISYTMGIDIGSRIKFNKKKNPAMRDINVDEFLAGLSDALKKEEKDFKITKDEMRVAMTAYRNKMIQMRKSMMQKVQDEGKKFLEEKKKEKGVIADKSGILYKILRKGTGKSPTVNDTVKVHYIGTLMNGKEFDSSYRANKPAIFNLKDMINAWKIILPKMKEGARWTIYVPSDQAYGARGIPPSIRPFETLVFNIELIKVNPKPEKAKEK